MKAVIQRVNKSWVEVDGKIVGAINKGINCLLGVEQQDDEEQAIWLADKIVNLRIFEDQQGKMNLSLLDINGELLVVSQFTLLADCIKGRRPSFTRAAPPKEAERLYNFFIDYLRQKYNIKVETGMFGAMMKVYIENDGPVTFIIDTREKFK
ncbi:D-tyrosyl-tRNA(Tyr) deacylase [Thermosulfidibacter takaii ABI70S6]|uniref:D-aminoacyl-tRNA deacylase n=1 Tax=Thermosulfidibacter takaii (strain DSM 17441 / JCM 13301 / NBRC 103674 / ABI70S6) TaxID=1298851 RepID=A0A0S3QUH0_THET7|nr:D-aminoacyl-tRNA deacylase [Thermosulfidibacter takaii]BAT71973.1 D-tyrosyl-tRNA(Tyr) deacylase [Thermosulfidibacter takaii ABI70S6]